MLTVKVPAVDLDRCASGHLDLEHFIEAKEQWCGIRCLQPYPERARLVRVHVMKLERGILSPWRETEAMQRFVEQALALNSSVSKRQRAHVARR